MNELVKINLGIKNAIIEVKEKQKEKDKRITHIYKLLRRERNKRKCVYLA